MTGTKYVTKTLSDLLDQRGTHFTFIRQELLGKSLPPIYIKTPTLLMIPLYSSVVLHASEMDVQCLDSFILCKRVVVSSLSRFYYDQIREINSDHG